MSHLVCAPEKRLFKGAQNNTMPPVLTLSFKIIGRFPAQNFPAQHKPYPKYPPDYASLGFVSTGNMTEASLASADTTTALSLFFTQCEKDAKLAQVEGPRWMTVRPVRTCIRRPISISQLPFIGKQITSGTPQQTENTASDLYILTYIYRYI